MSATSSFGPGGESRDGLKIRVYRVRLTAWAQRFADKVDASGGPGACWLWLARRDPAGYGRFQLHRRPALAHRVAYELAVGPIPAGLEIRHLCGNRVCCNPDPLHLVPGTHRENVADTVAMGRTTAGERHPLAKLTAADIPEIRRRRAAGEPARAIAQDLGVDASRIYQVTKGQGWNHVAVTP